MHGYLSSKESFIYQLNFLKQKFRVIAIDLPGFGKSPPLSFAYSLDDYVLGVIKVINNLNLKRYHIVAHSFGARIAIKLAAKDNRACKLVLTGAAGLKPKRSIKYYFKIYAYKFLKKFISHNKLKNFGSCEYRSLSGVMQKSYLKIVNEHLDKISKTVKNKTLIIFGENDKETPLYMAKRLNKNLKNSTLYVIKGAGHFAFVDQPLIFNVYLNEFLLGD